MTQSLLRSLPPQRATALTQKLASLEVCANDEKHGVEYLELTFLAVFIQTLNNVCSIAKMEHLFEHYFLCESIFRST